MASHLARISLEQVPTPSKRICLLDLPNEIISKIVDILIADTSQSVDQWLAIESKNNESFSEPHVPEEYKRLYQQKVISQICRAEALDTEWARALQIACWDFHDLQAFSASSKLLHATVERRAKGLVPLRPDHWLATICRVRAEEYLQRGYSFTFAAMLAVGTGPFCNASNRGELGKDLIIHLAVQLGTSNVSEGYKAGWERWRATVSQSTNVMWTNRIMDCARDMIKYTERGFYFDKATRQWMSVA